MAREAKLRELIADPGIEIISGNNLVILIRFGSVVVAIAIETER